MPQCKICLKIVSRNDSLKRHQLQHSKIGTKRKCNKCGNMFSSENYLKRHLRLKHSEQTIISTSEPQPSTSASTIGNNNTSRKRKVEEECKLNEKKKNKKKTKLTKLQSNEETIHCDACDMNVRKRIYTAHLKTNKHKSLSSVIYQSNNIKLIKTAFKCRIQSFKIENLDKSEIIFQKFFQTTKNALKVLIEEHVKIYTTIKVNIELFGLYELKKLDVVDTDIKSFNTKYEIISKSTDINETLNTWFEVIEAKADEFNEQNSGWSLLEISHFEININKFTPLRARAYVKLPKNISKKKCCG